MGNIKNILYKLAFSSLLIWTGNLFAIDNFNDIKPHSYGLNNISFGLTPATYSSISDDDNYEDSFGNGAGIVLHSKSSLKQYHYKKGEWFWDGGASVYLVKNKYIDKSNTNNLDLNVYTGIGYSTNYANILTALSLGIGYRHISDSDNKEDAGTQDAGTQDGAYLYGEYAIGSNFRYIPVGFIYKAMIKKGEFYQDSGIKNDIDLEQRLRMPIQVNKNRNHAITYTPEIRLIKQGDYEEVNFLFTIGLSWIYR